VITMSSPIISDSPSLRVTTSIHASVSVSDAICAYSPAAGVDRPAVQSTAVSATCRAGERPSGNGRCSQNSDWYPHPPNTQTTFLFAGDSGRIKHASLVATRGFARVDVG
jgi:hypothetical protein